MASVVVGATIAGVNVLVLSKAAPTSIGTEVTQQTSNGSYTDSADFKQNAQAVFERFGNGVSGQILQADANGKLQLVTTTNISLSLTSLDLSGSATVSGTINNRISTEALTASNTIAVAESNKVFFLSGATSTQTLPTSTPAGQKYTFFVSGSVTGNITVVTAGAENVIDGTIIVAGAVVDCDAEDTLTFVADGENVGDFFSLISTGSGWLIKESGALTSAKLTCTAT